MTVKTILRSKKLTAMIVGCLAAILIGTVILTVHFFCRFDLSTQLPVFLEGQYSVNDGDWKNIDLDHPIQDNFKKITFKGKFVDDIRLYNQLTISSKNIWYSLKNSKGNTITEYKYYSPEDTYKFYMVDNHYEEFFGKEYLDKEYFYEHFFESNPLASRMPNTPGYNVSETDLSLIPQDDRESDTYTLEVIYPYEGRFNDFSDCFSVLLSETNGKYLQFFFDTLPVIIFFVLICFFGVFFFPIASLIFGKIDYKYLVFGMMIFFWGLFMIAHNVSFDLNMWITDESVCLLLTAVTNYIFILSIIIYLKSNLGRSITRAIANCVAIGFLILLVTFIILHLTNVMDMHASLIYMFNYTTLCAIIMAVLLIVEIHINRQAYFTLVSWIPLATTLVIDAVNHYLHFAVFDFYNLGLGLTMLYQIIRLILDLRAQYKETIRYQQMQKELYEAKVSVMVSQIQPHFMYNTLSSIAMLCKIDPDTAHTATITFAQYLRSNMDSLKQTKLIPFEQELEHLKKYLYIEKLRFGKKLNIEYDIQTTDFMLPQLSIQPLAENAVKHGISKKRGGGTLTISTRETETAYEIEIKDDGVGFDTEAPKKDDGRSHIGMENIRTRLKEMCNAEIIINSKIGEGTVATVVLPKEDQNNENTVR